MLLLISGLLLTLALLIRLGIIAYYWSAEAVAGTRLSLLGINLLFLVGAGLLIRYARRLLGGGRLGDGPADETIL